ncbi:MAG: glycoside hydrolase family 3 C-terminal domain-containing protein [Pleomorphochaeta sp.]
MRDREWAIEKAKELVSKMSLEEKASQMRYDAPSINHLDVKEYNWWNEGLHGVARAGVATMFPQAIGLAATFDTELIKEIASAIADEARAKYNMAQKLGDYGIYKGLTLWSPNVNIFRDPRWGRGHETYGEDPFLSSEIGCSYVDGLQGDGKFIKAAACAKHFAVHSGPENDRHHFDAIASKEDMEKTYLPAFKALVTKSEVEGVMGAYNRVNGEPSCASETLQDYLRNKWGFSGYFVSDCWAIRDFHQNHKITETPADSVALAVKNGCDINCGCAYTYILEAIEKGKICEEDLDKCLVRIFTTRYLLGMNQKTEFDDISYDVIECQKHLNLAHKAAVESVVLLKNDGILPLNKDQINSIAVIGPNANSRDSLIGNYHGTSSRYITMLEAIQDEVEDTSIKIRYSEGCHLYKDKVEDQSSYTKDRFSEALCVANMSDLTIICLGLDETLEGEEGDEGNSFASGDKKDLKLPGLQNELIEEISKLNKPYIVVLLAGSSIDLSYPKKSANSVLVGWYPGSRGGKAISDIIFGNEIPSAKLPITFYKSADKLPDFSDYSMKGRTYRYDKSDNILYPFGYGLTYYDIDINKTGINLKRDKIYIDIEVENSNTEVAKDILQVYLIDEKSDEISHLCAFKKIELNPSEIKTEQLIINIEDHPIFIENIKDYTFSIGFSQVGNLSEELNKKSNLYVKL